MRPPTLAMYGILLACVFPTAGCSRQTQGQRAASGGAAAECSGLPDASALQTQLKDAAIRFGDAGGLNHGKFMWAAVVNRMGVLCATSTSTDDPAAVWPGSRGIAIAKATTANNFSSDTVPLSTARLYTLSLPGHSLWSIANGNPLNPNCLGRPDDPGRGVGLVCGGTIAFGGGVALYKDGRRIGGLGVSGDTSCADHEIAKRTRDILQLTPPGGNAADDIVYSASDGPLTFAHPLCPNTFKNGQKLGDESAQAPSESTR
jgi:uncharacterized protein GlcG (DUF336 family)